MDDRPRADDDPAALAAVVADLEQAHSRLNALLTAVPMALIELGLDGSIQLWNPGAEALYGFRARDVVGARLPTIRADEETFTSWVIDETLAGRPLRNFETVRWRQDGSAVDVSISTSAVFDQDDRPVGVLKAAVDMTERNRLQREARGALRMDLLGRLASGLAHDFNNLLTVILNHAHFIEAGTTLESSAHADAERVREAAERAARLTKQLLSLGQAREAAPTRAVDLCAAVAELQPLLAAMVGPNVTITMSDDGAQPFVMADQTQIEQLVSNLVINARDAMPRGGRIQVRAEVAVMRGEHLDAAHGGAFARLVVTDEGVGMTREVLDRVFEPFYTTKQGDAGSGLGLMVVHDVIERLGGFIDVQSTVGVGTRVTLYFPLAIVEGTASAAAAVHTALTGTESVLAVAGTPEIRSLIERTLQQQGYAVTALSSVSEALAWLHDPARPVRLVVTELFLPGAQGAALARSVPALRPNARVLMVTGRPVGELTRHGLNADPLHVIEKPFTPERLAERVRQCLDAAPRPLTPNG